jgi:magnesium transporter
MSADLLLVRAYAQQNPDEVARFIERLPPEEGAEVLAALEVETAANVLNSTVPTVAAATLTRLEAKLGAEILDACHPTLASSLLFRMERATRRKFLEEIRTQRAEELRRMIEWGPRRAGGRVDPRAPALPETLSVTEVLERLRAYPAGVMHYIYSIDDQRRLTGVVNMRELMLAAPSAPLGTIVFRDPDALYAHDPLEVVVRHAGWKRNHALPVIDRERHLLGAIRYSTFRAIETELGQAASGPSADQTASALAELCALGASAMTRFIGATLSLEGPPLERAPADRLTISPSIMPPSTRRSVMPGGMP